MILKALFDYANHRGLMDDPDYEERPVGCLIRIGRDGALLGFEPTFEPNAKGKPIPKRFNVPRGAGRTSGDLAFLLVDKSDYVLGFSDDPKKDGKPGKCAVRRELFIERIREAAAATDDEALTALLKFYDKNTPNALRPLLPDNHPPNQQYAFVYDPDGTLLVHERPGIRAYWQGVRRAATEKQAAEWTCLVTGEPCVPELTHPKIKGVRGASTSGGTLVSFNFDAALSYGFKQNENAPIGQAAAEAYTTALNSLLSPRADNAISLNDNTVACFWTRENRSGFESMVGKLLGSAENVALLYQSPKKGRPAWLKDEDRFYALTLSGAQGRIMVRDWFESSVADVAENLRRHFDDLALDFPFDDPPLPGLYGLLRAIVLQGKAENIPPNLAAQSYAAILRDGPYPLTLLSAAVRRCRAEGPAPNWHRAFLRTCVIKASLARGARKKTLNLSPEEVSEAMDPNNINTAYRLGRLFCVLELLQTRAIGNPNAGIADRFFGAASTNPVTVFPRLIKLSQHHVGKLGGSGIWYQQQVSEILEPVSGFPTTLDLKDQGLFALGYYHQRAEMFRKKEHVDHNGTENENTLN
ncbi:MAG: type I-C CRISPR-associated protein Cas8c/Csd1 [Candidatus Alcyoniella australis]|nr:type I-C CRISPR-associated protein Cas8c/Csd1 [Candidatus Alcyoniella australis]